MYDLPDQPVLDKHRMVGGCVRLPLQVDPQRLRNEVASLPASLWGTSAGRVGVHNAAEALFLRGYSPTDGDKPVEDRPALDQLPYVRSVISMLAAPPQRCVLARLPAGAAIVPHIDRGAPYFVKTLRIHVPVESHDHVWMACAGSIYVMRPGEVWGLNNAAVHAAWNEHATLSRTHLICDFAATPALIELHALGNHNLGQDVPRVIRYLDDLAAKARARAGRAKTPAAE